MTDTITLTREEADDLGRDILEIISNRMGGVGNEH